MQTKVFLIIHVIFGTRLIITKKHADQTIDWVDISNNQDAEVINVKIKKELLRRLHVIHEGEVVGGAKAFIIVWSKIPKYNFLSKIFKFKPLYVMFHYLYEIIAFFYI